MRLHVLNLPRLIAEWRSSALFGVLLIGMLWAGIALKYSEDVNSDLRDAQRINQNFAMVFEENVLRSIGEIDKALLYLRRSVETRSDFTSLTTIANTTDVLSEIIVQVAIIDAKGIMRASNVGPQPAPPTDLSDREHYRVHVGSNEDRLFISKPVVGRASRQWSVQLTRRFLNKDGSFGGVVVASLRPEHLTRFYDQIDFGSSASISLIGSDGVVRSSGGSAGGFVLGQDLSQTPLFERMRTGMNSTFDMEETDGSSRLVTLRPVRGHPLWVCVSTNRADIFKSSWSTLQINALAGGLLTLIILAAMEQLLRTETRARQKAEQLRLTLESISQGIVLVTKDLQIPIINGRCAELLDLPADFIKQPPRFDALVGYQPQAGISPGHYGGSEPFAVSERKMPNGTVIEVRTGSLPDGSFVQTYTDITKRHEAEAYIARLASEDPLTGLPNRRVLHAALDRLVQERTIAADGSFDAAEFAVFFLDLDRFKFVNDTLGHRIGDLLLQEVAARLTGLLQGDQVLARLGGDEFAIVVPAFQSRAALEKLAETVVEVIMRPYSIDGYQIRSSASVGIGIGPHDGRSADDL
ncbi:MAG: diguanylate cyclase, partial [Pseudorhodoplanes sp.]